MEAGKDDEIGRLFADITARLEDAHEVAAAGQNPRRSASERSAQAREVRQHVHAIDTAIKAIERLIERETG